MESIKNSWIEKIAKKRKVSLPETSDNKDEPIRSYNKITQAIMVRTLRGVRK